MFYQFIHPVTALIAGPSFSGKSTFLKNLLIKRRELFNVEFRRVLWAYSEISAKPEIEGIEFYHGLPDDATLDHPGPQLIILDDLMTSAFSSRICDIFTKEAHHKSMSIIIVSQNLFHQSKFSRTISLNTKYLVIFKSPRDRSQFSYLARQIYPENPRALENAFKSCIALPYGYLLVDLTQNCPDSIRFRSDIFSPNYSAVCYSNVDTSKESTIVEGENVYIVNA